MKPLKLEVIEYLHEFPYILFVSVGVVPSILYQIQSPTCRCAGGPNISALLTGKVVIRLY